MIVVAANIYDKVRVRYRCMTTFNRTVRIGIKSLERMLTFLCHSASRHAYPRTIDRVGVEDKFKLILILQ